tara:strand:- start:1920 stop:2168 length:249 start_codon:yes stop_codon:yes gene_type:complete
MALDATNLFKVGGANPGMWIYKSTDAVGTIDNTDYFNDVTNELKQFDVIVIIGSTGGGSPTVDLATVTSATGAASVTVALLA